jgi:hypothetical protein
MGVFVEWLERRKQDHQMDGKGTLCLLERKSICGCNKARPYEMPCIWNTRLECSCLCSGNNKPVDPIWTIPASHEPADLVGVCAMHGPDGAVATSVAAPSSPPRWSTLSSTAFMMPQNLSCRTGLKNHSKDTSNQTWQTNAFTSKKIKINQSLVYIWLNLFTLYDECSLLVLV